MLDSKWADRIEAVEKGLKAIQEWLIETDKVADALINGDVNAVVDELTTPEPDHQTAVDADLSKPLKVEPWQEEPCDPTKPDSDEAEDMTKYIGYECEFCSYASFSFVSFVWRLGRIEEDKNAMSGKRYTTTEGAHYPECRPTEHTKELLALRAEVDRLRGSGSKCMLAISHGCRCHLLHSRVTDTEVLGDLGLKAPDNG